jgi:hypothetical protein
MEKVFERILFKYIFNFLHEKDFISPLQSGFKPSDSTVNQLTFLYNSFCQALDDGLEIRVVSYARDQRFKRSRETKVDPVFESRLTDNSRWKVPMKKMQ